MSVPIATNNSGKIDPRIMRGFIQEKSQRGNPTYSLRRAAASFNKSLQATRDGQSSSASRFTSFGPACLSSER
jgi:hypothetical protein